MNYQFHIDTNPNAFDAFVQEHTYANLLQETKWAQIKDNWGHHFMTVTCNGEICASAMVLVKEMPLGFKLFYIPRGPIMDYENEELIKFFLTEMKKFARTQKAICIKFDPLVTYHSYALKEKDQREDYVHPTTELLKKVGAHHYGYNTDMYQVTQPRTQAVFYYFENYQDNYSTNMKRNLQRARNKGVQVKRVGKEGLEIFAELMRKTENRKGVALRNQEYFEKLMDTYQDDCAVFLTYMNLKELIEQNIKNVKALKEDLEKHPKTGKKLNAVLQNIESLEKEISSLEEYRKVDGDFVHISGILGCKDKHTAELLYAGMDGKYNKFNAPYISYLEAIMWAENAGCHKCNFGGVQGTLDDGLTSFKEKFLPTFEDYLGEFDLPVMPLFYRMFVVALPMAKKVLKGIRSWKK